MKNGQMMPTVDTLILLSDFYDVSIDYILGLDKRNKDINIELDLAIEYLQKLKK